MCDFLSFFFFFLPPLCLCPTVSQMNDYDEIETDRSDLQVEDGLKEK